MKAPEGSARPQHEVDAVEWLMLFDAGERLSYGRDRDVLEALLALTRR
jgi:hypothetical protein